MGGIHLPRVRSAPGEILSEAGAEVLVSGFQEMFFRCEGFVRHLPLGSSCQRTPEGRCSGVHRHLSLAETTRPIQPTTPESDDGRIPV